MKTQVGLLALLFQQFLTLVNLFLKEIPEAGLPLVLGLSRLPSSSCLRHPCCPVHQVQNQPCQCPSSLPSEWNPRTHFSLNSSLYTCSPEGWRGEKQCGHLAGRGSEHLPSGIPQVHLPILGESCRLYPESGEKVSGSDVAADWAQLASQEIRAPGFSRSPRLGHPHRFLHRRTSWGRCGIWILA